MSGTHHLRKGGRDFPHSKESKIGGGGSRIVAPHGWNVKATEGTGRKRGDAAKGRERK